MQDEPPGERRRPLFAGRSGPVQAPGRRRSLRPEGHSKGAVPTSAGSRPSLLLPLTDPHSPSAASRETITPDPISISAAEMDHMPECIEKEIVPGIGGERGLWNQKLMAACYESARVGRWGGEGFPS